MGAISTIIHLVQLNTAKTFNICTQNCCCTKAEGWKRKSHLFNVFNILLFEILFVIFLNILSIVSVFLLYLVESYNHPQHLNHCIALNNWLVVVLLDYLVLTTSKCIYDNLLVLWILSRGLRGADPLHSPDDTCL